MRLNYAGICAECGARNKRAGNFKNYETFRKRMEKRFRFIADCAGCGNLTVHSLTSIDRRPEGAEGPPAGAQTSAAWEAYAIAYAARYGVDPVRNAAVNAQLKAFVQRVPADEAPLIAAWYVTSNDRWFVQRGHSVSDLVANAERLRTEAVTGERMTQAMAIQADKGESRRQVWLNLISKLEARHDQT